MKVVIINGSGGSGKDTIVELLRTYFFDDYKVYNISTIDETKLIARKMGWGGEKDEKGRQFLADLKDAWTRYNNGANETVLQEVIGCSFDETLYHKEFIVFVHCREPEAIEWFVAQLKNRDIDTCTAIVKRENIIEFFNEADKSVDNYNYDITVYNDGSLEDYENIVKRFIKDINNNMFFMNAIYDLENF